MSFYIAIGALVIFAGAAVVRAFYGKSAAAAYAATVLLALVALACKAFRRRR